MQSPENPPVVQQAVILAGGLGTRLGELTKERPKPLLDVDGKPFLDYIIWNLRRQGIQKLLFSVGYLADLIKEHFGNGEKHGVQIDYVIEEKPAGTGGALRLAQSALQDIFFVLNGDTLFDVNMRDLALLLSEKHALACLALREVQDCSRYGSITLAADGRCTGFQEKCGQGNGLVSGGIYVMRKEALSVLPENGSSLEQDLFPLLVKRGVLKAKQYQGFFLDIGLPETYSAAQTDVPAWKKRPAVFFDRDGVINKDYGYVHTVEKFHWMRDAQDAVKWCNDHGYFAILVTNQAGIGRGYYTESHFNDFSGWIQNQLFRAGAYFDAVYYCPHHPTEAKGRYLKKCLCRKPEPGMLIQAINEFPIDVKRSIMVGNSESDMLAARGAGVRGVKYTSGSLLETVCNAMLDSC